MVALIIVLIVLAATGVLGFVMKGLMWLGVVALALFVVAAVFGYVKGRQR